MKTTSPRMRAPCAHHARTSRPQAPQARQETSHEHQRPSHRAPKPAPKAPNRPRRSQIGPEGAKPSPKAPNRPRRRHIGAEGAKPSQKAPSRHTRRQIGPEGTKSSHKEIGPENKHRPATAQPHARQGAQAKAEATQPTHESKRANMKQTMKHLTRVLRISSGNDTGFMNQIHLARRWQDHVKTIRKYQ